MQWVSVDEEQAARSASPGTANDQQPPPPHGSLLDHDAHHRLLHHPEDQAGERWRRQGVGRLSKEWPASGPEGKRPAGSLGVRSNRLGQVRPANGQLVTPKPKYGETERSSGQGTACGAAEAGGRPIQRTIHLQVCDGCQLPQQSIIEEQKAARSRSPHFELQSRRQRHEEGHL